MWEMWGEMAVTKEEVGQRIKNLRKTKTNLTQPQMAEQVGVGIGTYQTWEQGKYYPPPDAVWRMSNIFGVTMEHLYTGKDSIGVGLSLDEARLLKAWRVADSSGRADLSAIAMGILADALERKG